MTYLDRERLDALDAQAFRSRSPYPWVNPRGLLSERGYRELHDTLPELASFEKVFGKKRKYGQQSHDRYALEWEPGVEVSAPWRAFIEELEGPTYAAFLRSLLGVETELRYHWHYTPRGCSVSPHCDSKHKLGSHIFYFSDSGEWDPAWGGETLILDDGGRFHSDSQPDFDDFERSHAANTLDNHSVIFLRKGDSWHGVREITCPEGQLRKVFIVVFEKPRLRQRIGRLLGMGSQR